MRKRYDLVDIETMEVLATSLSLPFAYSVGEGEESTTTWLDSPGQQGPDSLYPTWRLEEVTEEDPVEPETKYVPPEISDQQFANALWKSGLITFQEALAFVRVGDLPVPLQDVVDLLPDEVRDDVVLKLSGATSFFRGHPFTVAIALAFGWDDERTDDFFRLAYELDNPSV